MTEHIAHLAPRAQIRQASPAAAVPIRLLAGAGGHEYAGGRWTVSFLADFRRVNPRRKAWWQFWK